MGLGNNGVPLLASCRQHGCMRAGGRCTKSQGEGGLAHACGVSLCVCICLFPSFSACPPALLSWGRAVVSGWFEFSALIILCSVARTVDRAGAVSLSPKGAHWYLARMVVCMYK
jgi:hypothetical protein